jgi:predicted dehydrogenase
MNLQNKYFNSDWRRNDEHCPGGFMMESSVHFIAALRMLAAAGGASLLYAPQDTHVIERKAVVKLNNTQMPLAVIQPADMTSNAHPHPKHACMFKAPERDALMLSTGQIADTHGTDSVQLGTAGAGEARQAWAHSSHANPELPSPDTLVGGLVFDAAVAATVSISFAAAQVRFSLSVVGTEGSLEV